MGWGGEVDLRCGVASGGSTVWGSFGGGHLPCGATLGESTVWGSFGGHLCGQLWGASVWATLGASTVWVNSDLPNTMCFKEASLKQEKEGKSGPQTP